MKQSIKSFNCKETPFPDVSNNWSRQPICYLKEQGLLNGDKGGKFNPDQPVTLYEGLKMVLKAYGFGDYCYPMTEGGAWYEKYVIGGAMNGLIENLSDRSLSRGESVKLVGEAKKKMFSIGICGGVREFKTSLDNVGVRAEKNTVSDKKVIENLNTKIYVLRAVEEGEYVDAYKTDRWYDVVYNGKNGMGRGWVLATLVHPEWISFEDKRSDLNCKNYAMRPQNNHLNQIVLHGTAINSSSASNAANAFKLIQVKNKDNIVTDEFCSGAHFFVGYDGDIVQVRTIDNLIFHAGFGGNTSLHPYMIPYSASNSYNSVGIEMVNVGAFFDQKDDTFIDVSEVVPNAAWTAWTSGWAWGRFDFKFYEEELFHVEENISNVTKWEVYTSKQYETVNKLLKHLEESTGIPYQMPVYSDEDNLNGKYAYYYFPKAPGLGWMIESVARTEEEQKEILQSYRDFIHNFSGIVSHHGLASKWDTGPVFNICDDNLDYINKKEICN